MCACVCVYVCVCVFVCMYVYYIFFIHSSVDRHLGCFHILSIIKNAAINIGVYTSFRISGFAFLRYTPRSGIAGSYGTNTVGFPSGSNGKESVCSVEDLG